MPDSRTAGNINLDHAGNLDLRRLLDLLRLKAWECPIAGRRTVNTRIMSILCNAMQFKVQCRMPDPDGVRFRRVNPSIPPAANPAKPLSGSGDTPPSLVEGFERPQLFGLAASIAARLTIWPIS